MPVLGNVTHYLPEKEIIVERTLDLNEDLFLHDHLFVYAECKTLEERLPILPLTMSLEFAAEAAALLSPGLGLIGFENVRGLRWIGLRDCPRTKLRLEAQVESEETETGVRRVHCTIFFENQASFTAVALFAEGYRQDVVDAIEETSAAGPWLIGVEQVYGERHMFHGPRFGTIDGLDTFGNPGASGSLKALPRDQLFASNAEPLLLTDPCLMDGLGQFVGLWARMHEQFVLPISVEKIEFYAPPPSPGTRCPIRMEVVAWDADARQMRSNIDLEDGAGQVCVRVRGWSDWILNWPPRYERATSRPEQHLLAEEIALPDLPENSVCTRIERDAFAGVDLDWASRFFFHTREMPRFHEAKSKDRRRQLVAATAAVKDAVRLWWSRQHDVEMPHPAEFALDHDERGQPFLVPDDDPALPHISLTHTASGAVALAADTPVGIDLEDAERDTRAILAEFTTEDEGVGLNGRPKDLEAIDIEEDGSFLIRYAPTGERLLVRSVRVDSFLLAWSARSHSPFGIAAPHGNEEAFAGIMDQEIVR
jgi:hypothetical protein